MTTEDELQLCFVGGGKVVGGPLTLRHSYAEPDDHWSSGGDDHGRAFVGGGVVGGPLTLRGRRLRGDTR